jgi:hypothetical protein
MWTWTAVWPSTACGSAHGARCGVCSVRRRRRGVSARPINPVDDELALYCTRGEARTRFEESTRFAAASAATYHSRTRHKTQGSIKFHVARLDGRPVRRRTLEQLPSSAARRSSARRRSMQLLQGIWV